MIVNLFAKIVIHNFLNKQFTVSHVERKNFTCDKVPNFTFFHNNNIYQIMIVYA